MIQLKISIITHSVSTKLYNCFYKIRPSKYYEICPVHIFSDTEKDFINLDI